MPTAPNHQSLAQLLPGTWRIGATNFPMWIGGERLFPTFSYELRTTTPLVLLDTVSYTTAAGKEKRIVGLDRWKNDDFVWRGKGVLMPFTSRWSVAGASEDGSILVIRFTQTRATPAGIDVVVRDTSDTHAFRTAVSASSEMLGLTQEDFASLTWLDFADS